MYVYCSYASGCTVLSERIVNLGPVIFPYLYLAF